MNMNLFPFQIRQSSKRDTASRDVVRRVAELINSVYRVAEEGMWVDTFERTSETEVEKLLGDANMLIAQRGGEIIGAIFIRLLGEGMGEFGMLVADPNLRGAGIGSRLVKAAENWAKENGCHTMRLELLTPRDWAHPVKEFLKKWYTRIGYVPQTTVAFDSMYPQLKPLLKTACNFTPWLKSLE